MHYEPICKQVTHAKIGCVSFARLQLRCLSIRSTNTHFSVEYGCLHTIGSSRSHQGSRTSPQKFRLWRVSDVIKLRFYDFFSREFKLQMSADVCILKMSTLYYYVSNIVILKSIKIKEMQNRLRALFCSVSIDDMMNFVGMNYQEISISQISHLQ